MSAKDAALLPGLEHVPIKVCPMQPLGAYGSNCGLTPFRGTQICLGEAAPATCECPGLVMSGKTCT